MDLLFGIQDSLGKFFRILQRQLQHMEGKPLGSLAADTGKPGKLVSQILQRRREKLHSNLLVIQKIGPM
jgi:hypothetical protein